MESKFLVTEAMIDALVGKTKYKSAKTVILKEIINNDSYVFYSDGRVTFTKYIVERFDVSRARATQIANGLVEDNILEKISKHIYHIKGLSKHG